MLPRRNWFPLKTANRNWKIEWKFISTRRFHSFGRSTKQKAFFSFPQGSKTDSAKASEHRDIRQFQSAYRNKSLLLPKSYQNSKSTERKFVPVRFRPEAPSSKDTPGHGWEVFYLQRNSPNLINHHFWGLENHSAASMIRIPS